MTFLLARWIPGNPFSQEQALPKEIMEQINRTYGLDRPHWEQFLGYFQSLVQGDLGHSMRFNHKPVTAIIAEAFPISLAIGIPALLISLLGGILWGMLIASYRTTFFEKFSDLYLTLAIAIPNFLLAALLQYFLGYRLQWFPVAQWGTPEQCLLPILALCTMPLAWITRLVMVNYTRYLSTVTVLALRSRGLTERTIAIHYGLRHVILPLLPYLGQLTANILTGSFVIEKVFAIPGLGQWLVTSVTYRDYDVIAGIVLLYSALLLSVNFLTELLYLALNPIARAKQQEAVYAV